MHFRAILIAFGILTGSSSISTISAASIAASEPSAPIAIPISALDNTGASFIPSPVNAVLALLRCSAIIRSSISTLSPGSSSLYTSSNPSSAATASAVCFTSPVSITVLMPRDLSCLIASAELDFILSDIIMHPANTPSADKYTFVPGISILR